MGEKEQSAAEDAAGQPDAVPPLPPGVKLVRTLRGHKNWIGRIAWSPDGRLLASPSADKTIRLWDGTEESSFPPLLHGRVYADFREPMA